MFTVFWYMENQHGNYGEVGHDESGEYIGSFAEVTRHRDRLAASVIKNGGSVKYENRKRIMNVTKADGTQDRYTIGNAQVPWSAVGGREYARL